MGDRVLRIQGFSLVELTVGLCVASIIATLAAMSMAAAGVAVGRHLLASRSEDKAWLALAAIVRDLENAAAWAMCTEARDCPHKQMAREYNAPVLLADRIGWLAAADDLRRCDRECLTFVDGVASLEVVADIPAGDGLTHRQPFLQRHGSDVRALEVTLEMRDGRRFSRAVSQRKPRR
jgi:prepilin-type N-terminal cleavage/methylation domain-containing protein